MQDGQGRWGVGDKIEKKKTKKLSRLYLSEIQNFDKT